MRLLTNDLVHLRSHPAIQNFDGYRQRDDRPSLQPKYCIDNSRIMISLDIYKWSGIEWL